MFYLIFALALGTCCLFALRDRPPWHYAALYIVGTAVGWLPEFTFSELFHLYDLYTNLFPGRGTDATFTALLKNLALNPFLGLLFVRYGRRRPLVAAPLWAAALGALEVILLQAGLVRYNWWSPALTVAMYTGFFLLAHQADRAALQIPLWLQADLLAFLLAFVTEHVFHGAMQQWHYTPPITGDAEFDTRLQGLLYVGVVFAPVVAAAALVPNRWVWLSGAAAVALLLGLDAGLLAAGVVVHHGWRLAYTALASTLQLAATALYTRWYRAAAPT